MILYLVLIFSQILNRCHCSLDLEKVGETDEKCKTSFLPVIREGRVLGIPRQVKTHFIFRGKRGGRARRPKHNPFGEGAKGGGREKNEQNGWWVYDGGRSKQLTLPLPQQVEFGVERNSILSPDRQKGCFRARGEKGYFVSWVERMRGEGKRKGGDRKLDESNLSNCRTFKSSAVATKTFV